MTFTPDPDSRIVALIVRDLAQRLPRSLGGCAVAFDLTGPAGGCFRICARGDPAHERAGFQPARLRVVGDATLARQAVEHTMVVY